MMTGVPEGPQEIVPGTSLPLESSMDVMGGSKLTFFFPCHQRASTDLFLHIVIDQNSRLSKRLLCRARINCPNVSHGKHSKTNHAHPVPPPTFVLFEPRRHRRPWSYQVVRPGGPPRRRSGTHPSTPSRRRHHLYPTRFLCQ